MIKENWIIKDLLSVTADFLKNKKIESPRLCAEILLSCQLDTDRLKLYLEYDQPISMVDVNGYREMIKRLINGEPIQALCLAGSRRIRCEVVSDRVIGITHRRHAADDCPSCNRTRSIKVGIG